MKAEFFDIFGFMGFIIILIISMWMLKSKDKLPNWAGVILLSIAILGLIIDGTIIIKTYLLRG